MTNNISIIWSLSKDKILGGLKNHGKRSDGRKLDEYRKIVITKDISENADGSARVKLGETDVIAGVKLVPGAPYPDSPGEGTISVGVELLSIASPDFETGPPSEGAIELGRVVDRGIRESKAIDFKDLCIEEGVLVWTVFVDIYVLNDDGNLFDACGIAALSALMHAKIPKLEEGKVVQKEYSENTLELSRIPVLNTFAKIGDFIVADPSLEESMICDARFSVTVTEDNYLSAFQKGGRGFFTAGEISQCIDIAVRNSEEIRRQL